MTVNPRTLFFGWTVISFAVLFGSLYKAESKEDAAPVAFVMTILSFPSSAIAGKVLNSNNARLSEISSPKAFIATAWLPFFLVGTVQWLVLCFLAQQVSRRPQK